MNKKIKFFSLITLCLTMVSCASFDDGYDDPINIRTVNTDTVENAEMQRYFRKYINHVMGDRLVGTFSRTRTARFTLKIDVLEKDKESAGHRLHIRTPHGRRKFNEVHYYSYKIKIDLIDNKKNGLLVWSWEPAKWKTYPTKQKSIKWLARYSAKRMVKARLFSSLYLR